MALRSGMNFTASDMKKLLEENDRTQRGVRSWREKFGNASLAYGASTGTLRSDYTDVISQAYKSNLAQQNTILGSGLSASAMSDAVAMSRMDLHNAYSQYISNYGKASNELAAGYQSELKGIDTMLTDRAKNFANLYSNAYTYLSDVLNNAKWRRDNYDAPTYEGKGKKAKQTGWEQIETDYLSDHQMAGLRDKNNNLLSWDQLSHKFFNPDGSLNKEGVRFFDQVFNARPEDYTDEEGHAIRSFDEWLSETDPELREWYASQDEFNYNFDGRNKGTANVMLGRGSADDAYAPKEYVDIEDAANVNESNRKTFNEHAKFITKSKKEVLSAYKNNFGVTNTRDQENTRKLIDETTQEWDNYRTSMQKGIDNAYSFIRKEFGEDLYSQFVQDTQEIYKEYEDLTKDLTKSYTAISSDDLYAATHSTDLPDEFYQAFGYEKDRYGKYVNADGSRISDKDRMIKYQQWMIERMENWYNDTEKSVSELNAWYDKFTKYINDFVKKYGYSSTSSGL